MFIRPIQKHLRRLLPAIIFSILSLTSNAQTAGFTATIGSKVLQVKNGDVLKVCKGETILYKSTASNFSSLIWRYDNGSVSTVSLTSFSVNYPTAGNAFYTVQTVSGTVTDSLKVKVIVSDKDPLLKASFSYSPITVECGNKTFSFTSSSKGTNLSYNWDFGDGGTAVTKDASHVFDKAVGPGGNHQYTVTLTVTDENGCSDVTTQTITVKNIPDATLGNDPLNADFVNFNGLPTFSKCEKLATYTFTFVNKSSTVSTNTQYKISWDDMALPRILTSWNLNDTIQHEYKIGNTVLTIEVTGANGCIATKKYNVFIGTDPGGSFGLIGNQKNLCVDSSAKFLLRDFKDNPPGTLYKIIVNDGSPEEVYQHEPPDTVSHAFARSSCGITSGGNPNSFTVSLLIENPCSSQQIDITKFYISDNPKAANISKSRYCGLRKHIAFFYQYI